MKNINYLFLIIAMFFASCENQEWEFPDFEYQTVYFAHQYPVRTITLGDDIFDTSLDNEWKFKIMATTGGVYKNEKDIAVGVTVDNALVKDLLFEAGGNEILAMPDEYYSLASDKIIIPGGSLVGGVEVQLTEAFFADPLSIQKNYVIPMRMTYVEGADSILSGVGGNDGPRRGVSGDWAIQPKDFTFYAVKFINPWHGFYLRRGEDEITRDGVPSSVVRHAEFVEDDDVFELTTLSFNDLLFPLDYKSKEGHDLGVKIKLNFDDDQKATVSPEALSYQVNDSVRVYNVAASGTGSFVEKGEKKSWGNQDRDALYLEYDVSYEVEIKFPKAGLADDIEQVTYSTTDTLVMRNRGVVMETFSPVLK